MQYGSKGWSIGYAQAVPEKRVIACIGDGSFHVGLILVPSLKSISTLRLEFISEGYEHFDSSGVLFCVFSKCFLQMTAQEVSTTTMVRRVEDHNLLINNSILPIITILLESSQSPVTLNHYCCLLPTTLFHFVHG